MTASAPFRSVSLCQTTSARWPSTAVAAWYASWSQFDPGKTITANFMTVPASVDFHPIALDNGVRKELVRHFGRQGLGVGRIRRREVELEVLALPYVLAGSITHRVQGVGISLPLRIEY